MTNTEKRKLTLGLPIHNNIKTKAELEAMEEFQVIIKLPSMPLSLRLTYFNDKSSKLTSIDEINASEGISCGCTFKGRSATCNGGAEWLKAVRTAFSGMKPKDWEINDCYVDSFYKIN